MAHQIEFVLTAEGKLLKNGVAGAEADLAKFEKGVLSLQGRLSKMDGGAEGMAKLGEAIKRMGGASQLTGQQLEYVKSRVAQLSGLGAKVPQELAAISKQLTADKLGGAALAQLQQASAGLTGSLGQVGAALGSLGPVGLAAAAGVGALALGLGAVVSVGMQAASSALSYGANIQGIADKSGIAADAVQRFIGAGINIEDVTGAVQKMQAALVNTPEKFSQLGLSAASLIKMKPDESLGLVVKQVSLLGTQAEKTAAMNELLGKSFPLSTMKDFADLAEKGARAEGLGLVNDSTATMKAFKEETQLLGKVWDSFMVNLGTAIVTTPGLMDAVKGVTNELGSFSKWILENRTDIQGFVKDGIIPAIGALERLIGLLKSAAQNSDALLAAIPGATMMMSAAVAVTRRLGGGGKMPSLSTGSGAGLRLGDAYAGVNLSGLKSHTTLDAPTKPPAWASAASISAAEKAASAAAKQAQANIAQLNEEIFQLQEGIIQAGLSARAAAMMAENAAWRTQVAGSLDEQIKDQLALGQVTVSTAAMNQAVQLGALAGMKDLTSEQYKQASALIGLGQSADAAYGAVKSGAEQATEKGYDLRDAFVSVGDAIAQIGGRMGGIGSVVGSLASGVAGVAANYKNKEERAAMSTGDKAGAAANAGVTAFSIYEDNKHNMSAGKGAMDGAGKGAAAGAAFGPYGAIIGAVVGGLIGAFSGSGFRKMAKQAGQTLGIEVSKELAEAIEKTKKKLKVGTREAALLNISGAMSEATEKGLDVRQFSGQVSELMSGIKNGSIPAVEGLAQVGQAFLSISDAAMKAKSVGDRTMVDIIKRSREMGLESPEIKAFVAEQLAAAAAGLNAFIVGKTATDGGSFWQTGLHITERGYDTIDPKLAQSQATIFSAVFWATVKEQGIVGASDAMRASLGGFVDVLKELGGDAAAEATLGPIMRLMGLTEENMAFRGAIEGAEGLRQALEGVANAGYMTTDTFSAFETQAQAAFNQAVDGGATAAEAYQAMGPLLQSIVSASNNYGIGLDAQTSAMIEQAKAAGVAFQTSPIDRAAEAMERLVMVLGKALGVSDALGSSFSNLGAGASGNYSTGGSSDTGPVRDYGYGSGIEGMAEGGYVPPRAGGKVIRVAEGGQGEYVGTADRLAEMGVGGRSAVININIGDVVAPPGTDGQAFAGQFYRSVRDGLLPEIERIMAAA